MRIAFSSAARGWKSATPRPGLGRQAGHLPVQCWYLPLEGEPFLCRFQALAQRRGLHPEGPEIGLVGARLDDLCPQALIAVPEGVPLVPLGLEDEEEGQGAQGDEADDPDGDLLGLGKGQNRIHDGHGSDLEAGRHLEGDRPR